MKKNDWLIALCAICFSVLFYEQNPGINFLIFSSLAGSLAILFNKDTLDRKWYFYFGAHLLMAWNIFFVDSDLSIIAWLFSFIWLIGNTLHASNSALLAGFTSFLSPVHAFWTLLSKLRTGKEPSARRKKMIYAASFGAALILVLVFLALYKGANPLFDKFTDAIDLSWINLPFLLMTVFGFIILLTLVYPYKNEYMSAWDTNKLQNTLKQAEQDSGLGIFARMTGSFIFGGLNIMLLILNVLDVNYIFVDHRLPKGMNLADFVQDSVAAIVFSILMAISIILLTRNFTSKSKIYRILVYGWIAQSFVMLFHTFIRNSWYISEYQLTYLRIGVFVFLGLCVLGLVFTIYILRRNRTYWLLFDLNIKSWLLVLCLAAFVNWDGMITRYNLGSKSPDKVDIQYLLGLSGRNTALLLHYYRKHPGNFDHYQLSELVNRKRWLVHEVEHSSWQSFSLARVMQYKQLKSGN
ncbi:MAG: DUF4173 domain-containing protein [Bacteroidota bacterium]